MVHSTEEEELRLLTTDPFERPAEVCKEDIAPLVDAQASIMAELKNVRAEIAEKDSLESQSIQSVDGSSSSEPVTNNDFKVNPKQCALTTKVNLIEERWSKIDFKLSDLLKRLNGVEQYGRLYNLLIHDVFGVPFRLKGLAFSAYVVRLLNNLLGKHLFCPVQLCDIDKSHPLYQKNNGKYVIIVRFVRRDIRDAIFYQKEKLEETNTGITITENLTEDNMKLLKSAEKTFGKENVFTDQGKIYALLNGTRKIIKNELSISKLLNKIINIPIDDSHAAVANTPPPQSNSTVNPSFVANSFNNNHPRDPRDNNGRSVGGNHRRANLRRNLPRRSVPVNTMRYHPHTKWSSSTYYNSNYNPRWGPVDNTNYNFRNDYYWQGPPNRFSNFHY